MCTVNLGTHCIIVLWHLNIAKAIRYSAHSVVVCCGLDRLCFSMNIANPLEFYMVIGDLPTSGDTVSHEELKKIYNVR